MADYYKPKSDFVALAASGDVSLTGSPQADGNLKRLIGFTKDSDKSNRDWATMALGMYGPDTVETRQALLAAADDEDCDVRGEAVEALARRNVSLALSIVQKELSRPECGYGVFIAAGLIAEPSLVELLRAFPTDTEASWINENILEAIRACKTGTSVEHWRH